MIATSMVQESRTPNPACRGWRCRWIFRASQASLRLPVGSSSARFSSTISCPALPQRTYSSECGLVPGSSLVLDPIYLRAGRTILSDLPTFGTNAGLAYSDYIEESAVGIIDLIKMVATFMIEQETFAASLATLSLTLPANALLSTIFDPQSTLAQAVLAADADALLTEIAIAISQLPGADANLTMALAVVESLRSLRNLFSELVSMEPAELFDLIGEVPLFIAEMMRDRVLQTKLEEIADSPAMLGEIFGMLLAVVIWEIVEEVATMGLAKPMKLLKVAT
jgi:hypothetical protein